MKKFQIINVYNDDDEFSIEIHVPISARIHTGVASASVKNPLLNIFARTSFIILRKFGTKTYTHRLRKPDHVSLQFILLCSTFYSLEDFFRLCIACVWEEESTIVLLVFFKRKYRFLFFLLHNFVASNLQTEHAEFTQYTRQYLHL